MVLLCKTFIVSDKRVYLDHEIKDKGDNRTKEEVPSIPSWPLSCTLLAVCWFSHFFSSLSPLQQRRYPRDLTPSLFTTLPSQTLGEAHHCFYSGCANPLSR